jgi:hypothetical protein
MKWALCEIPVLCRLQAQAYYRASGEARSPYEIPPERALWIRRWIAWVFDFAIFCLSIHETIDLHFSEAKSLDIGNRRIFDVTTKRSK